MFYAEGRCGYLNKREILFPVVSPLLKYLLLWIEDTWRVQRMREPTISKEKGRTN
jgi:hypothetical protein